MTIWQKGAALVRKVLDVESMGQTVVIHRFLATAAPNRYRQGTKTYRDPVDIRCLLEESPSPEMLSEIGSTSGEVSGVVTLFRVDLQNTFPAQDVRGLFTNSDELTILGRRKRVVEVLYGGNPSALPEFVNLTFKDLPETPANPDLVE